MGAPMTIAKIQELPWYVGINVAMTIALVLFALQLFCLVMMIRLGFDGGTKYAVGCLVLWPVVAFFAQASGI